MSKKHDCLSCGKERPLSHAAVWENGSIVGRVCADHTLYELLLPSEGSLKFDVEVSFVRDEQPEWVQPKQLPDPPAKKTSELKYSEEDLRSYAKALNKLFEEPDPLDFEEYIRLRNETARKLLEALNERLE